MLNISVVIITFNEEHNIKRCIDSVTEITDDIVVVDSFSTDNTEKIALEYKQVNFIKHAFQGHIEQKNWAKDQAKNEWVLSLDADEALSDELKNSIKKLEDKQSCDGFTMNRLTNYCGKWIRHCGWYPDTKLRLWKRNSGIWSGVNPHDRFELNNNCISHLKGDILHYSYPTIESHLYQIIKFSGISAREKYNAGKKISLPLFLLRPLVIFLKKYIFKFGFMDGYYGFIISVFTAYGVFIKDLLLREMHKNNGQQR